MRPELIVIGVSLGGLKALETILAGLEKIQAPIVIVQHTKSNIALLADLLQRHTQLPVKEADDAEELRNGAIYIAPSDYHLMIENNHCALSLEAPVEFCRPSINVLFETASHAFGERLLAIVLTGNNSDGAIGAALVKANGGMVIVQDPEDCEAPSMPRATISTTKVDQVLKLTEIAPYLVKLCS